MLEASAVRKEFGGLVAVDDVTFEIGEEEIVGLIGPNGAGKTTLFDTISGVHRADGDATIRFDGIDLAGRPPHIVSRSGLVRTFQIVRVFGEMSVLENAVTGATFGSDDPPSRAAAEDRAIETLEFVGLGAKRDAPAATLTVAEQKRLELARALATDPKLVMLDELASGLTPGEIDEISGVIRRIRDEQGISVFWIEHIMDAIMGTADRIIVLSNGRKIAAGTPAEIRANEEVTEVYLGNEAAGGTNGSDATDGNDGHADEREDETGTENGNGNGNRNRNGVAGADDGSETGSGGADES
jgi:branched-chain amino acid transport system ATP-binding protein